MKLLVVEDETSLSQQLSSALAAAGYAVDCAADGERADFLARTERYDAIVLDLGLPRVDGLTVLGGWRRSGMTVPVLILTARTGWHETVHGIDEGADDYVSKPFRMEEVLARLRALIRRSSGQIQPAIRCGAVELDPRLARVTRHGMPVKLTSHEFRVLVLPDAPSHTCRVAERADRAHLLAGFRSRLQYRGSVHRPAEAQAGRVDHRDGARSGIPRRIMSPPFSLRGRLLFGTVLWTIGLIIIASAALIFAIESHHAAVIACRCTMSSRGRWSSCSLSFAMFAGYLQVRRGVSPINNLRARLAGLHQGRDRRIEGTYPTEVQPLVTDLNALLENREQAVRRAIAKAGDLAHGLKTPLAILAHEAERARAAGQTRRGCRCSSSRSNACGRQVDYHLAHARAAAAVGAGDALLDQGIRGRTRARDAPSPRRARDHRSTSACRPI